LHVLLYRSLGWTASMPAFAHLPLLLKPEGGGKLSKRDGDRLGFPVFPLRWRDPKNSEIAEGYRESGYLPEAVVNFLALLGWNPGDNRELMSMQELIDSFDLNHCSKNGAKFDFEKGKWFNHQYIQQCDNRELALLFAPVLESHGVEAAQAYVEKIVGMMKERVNLIPELWAQTYYFFVAPTEYNEKIRAKRWKEDSAIRLAELIEVLHEREPFDIEGTEQYVKAWIEQKGYHLGNIMNAVRLALVGEGIGPQIFHITEAIGKEETIRRIRRAIDVMG
jgi:Glutamyl- and glutaminyl-tRNA synthetases